MALGEADATCVAGSCLCDALDPRARAAAGERREQALHGEAAATGGSHAWKLIKLLTALAIYFMQIGLQLLITTAVMAMGSRRLS